MDCEQQRSLLEVAGINMMRVGGLDHQDLDRASNTEEINRWGRPRPISPETYLD